MTKSKGRPKGSEKDDSQALNAIADRLHLNPAIKPTTALRRHKPEIGDAEVRRVQAKWKDRKETLLAAAKVRADAKRVRRSAASNRASRTGLGAVAEAARTAREIYNSPEMRVMREFQQSPTARAIWEMQNSPAMVAIREAQNSPAMQLAREMHNSPSMRIAREIAQAQAELNKMLGGW